MKTYWLLVFVTVDSFHKYFLRENISIWTVLHVSSWNNTMFLNPCIITSKSLLQMYNKDPILRHFKLWLSITTQSLTWTLLDCNYIYSEITWLHHYPLPFKKSAVQKFRGGGVFDSIVSILKRTFSHIQDAYKFLIILWGVISNADPLESMANAV